jgi:hypothetical protein
MMTPDLPEPGSPPCADGASADVGPRPEAATTRFESILFERAGAGPGVAGPEQPDFFADLNLDQVLESMTAGRDQRIARKR